MNYAEALDDIFSLAKFGSKLGLERIRRLTDRLGNPEQRLEFIHVAGTKGKGSVCAFTARILEEAGYKVGLYISPSLVNAAERISIGGEMITPAEFLDVFAPVWTAMQDVSADDPVTVFEAFTAVALLYFEQQHVDVVVWEVGLGGLYDATNIIPTPSVAVITNIGLEHTDRLGDTVELIATQKGGVMKSGGTVVIGQQDFAAAHSTLVTLANQTQKHIVVAGQDYVTTGHQFDRDHVRFDYHGTVLGCTLDLPGIVLTLRGIHQIQNAASAISAATAFALQHTRQLPEAVVRTALIQTFWPGRLELVPGTPPILLDGAHTQTAARYLVDSLHAHFPGQRFVMLFGVLQDKDMDGIAEILAPEVDTIVLTSVPETARTANPWELQEKFRRYRPHSSIIVEDDFEKALLLSQTLTSPDSWVLVTGSLYLVGAVRRVLGLYTFTRP